MTKPIIPWHGGKRRLAKLLLPMFPKHICYVEPFCGGAALFFMKEPSKVEVINDINGELTNLYRVVKHHLHPFIDCFKWELSSRSEFLLKQKQAPEALTDIQRAVRFFYLQKLSFGGRTHKRTYGTATTTPTRLNLARIEEDLSAAHLRLTGVNIEHLPWDEVIKRYDRPHTFFYLDPPYWQTTGYASDLGLDDYVTMADLARNIKGKMLLSLNDHPEIRQVFNGLDMTTTNIKYSLARVGKYKKSEELIIKNY